MPSEEIDQLKSHPDILRVYAQYTRLSKEAGGRYRGLCPLHKESSGSFVVYDKDKLFSCFGCNSNGNAIQLVQKVDNLSFKEAVEKVRSIVGESNYHKQAAMVDATFRQVTSDESKTKKTYTLAQYKPMEDALAGSEAAKDWLASRGIPYETAQRLHLGFKRTVEFCGKDNDDIKSSGWVAFPTVDGDTVTSIKYRSIVRKVFCKQAGMKTDLFNLNTVDMFEPVYLVEGEMDAATLEAAGFRAVSLASASSHPTPEQKDRLMQASIVILAGDCDGAVGEEIMNKLWRELGERTYLLKWPDGCKDANDLLTKVCRNDVSAFRTRVMELTQLAKTVVMPDVYSIQEVMRNAGEGSISDHPHRLHFPWPEVDNMAVLLPGSVLALYATQTGQGKTAWATQVALYGARKYNEVVVSYQCELSPEEIAVMVTAQVLHKNRNFLTKQDQADAADKLEGVKFYVGSNPSLEGATEILDLLEAAVARLSASVLIIDHFHHVTRSETNENAIQGAAARRIKQMAQKYGLKVISVGQPRKANQGSKGRKTHITDAKGNGAYADDADAVFALHRELAKSDEANPATDTYEAKTLIHAQKTRSKGAGGKAECYLTFLGEYAEFIDVTTAYDGV